MSDLAAQRLIYAICMQACHDYAKYKKKLEKYPRDTQFNRLYSDAKRFIKSSWWDALMPNVNGEKVLKKLDEIISEGEEVDDVCKFELRKSVEDIPTRKERSEIYEGTAFNEPEDW